MKPLAAPAPPDGGSKSSTSPLSRPPSRRLPHTAPLPPAGRELAEEIGWTGPLALDPGFVTHFDYTSGSGRKARQYTFGLAHHGRPIILSTEHTAYRWLPPPT